MEYHRETRELRINELVLRNFRRDASLMIEIAEAFDDAGFAQSIPNPLWNNDDDEDVQRSRTQKCVAKINAKCIVIKFHTASSGRYLSWSFLDVKNNYPRLPVSSLVNRLFVADR